ncbi:hypothetical protein TRVL_08591 [Trypanosoma vivax]|nr:hypothetical protein TRVL_08591 [Trypanosoma vivax]
MQYSLRAVHVFNTISSSVMACGQHFVAPLMAAFVFLSSAWKRYTKSSPIVVLAFPCCLPFPHTIARVRTALLTFIAFPMSLSWSCTVSFPTLYSTLAVSALFRLRCLSAERDFPTSSQFLKARNFHRVDDRFQCPCDLLPLFACASAPTESHEGRGQPFLRCARLSWFTCTEL